MEFDFSEQGSQSGQLPPHERKEMQDFLKATEVVALWLTKKLRNRTEWGAFSEAYIGEPAVDYFTHRLSVTFVRGNWVRYKDEKMSTFLIRMVKSDMRHHVDIWRARGEPMMNTMSLLSDEQKDYAERVTSEVLKDLDDGDVLRSISLSIAEKVAEGDKEVEKYVKAMEASNNYRDITKRMKMNMKQVGVVEERLYEKVKPYAMTAKKRFEF